MQHSAQVFQRYLDFFGLTSKIIIVISVVVVAVVVVVVVVVLVLFTPQHSCCICLAACFMKALFLLRANRT